MGKRIKKQKPKPHVLIPDTSTLWHDDKQHVVDPRFDEFWDGYASPFSLELAIPENGERRDPLSADNISHQESEASQRRH